MGRSIRRQYPPKLNYIIRLNAGRIQKQTGLPASFIHRLRRGEVYNVQEKTLLKLNSLYDDYWTKRLTKKGARSDETRSWIRANYTPERLRVKQSELLEVAYKLKEARDRRDSKHPNFKKSWHSIKDITEQMSRDVSRSAGDWLQYAKKVITGGGNYRADHVRQWEEKNKRYKRRKRRKR